MISGLVMTPMFLWFASQEVQLARWDMAALTVMGALICLANVWMVQYRGLRKAVLRFSIAYIFAMALYYVHTGFATSSLLFCVVLPFAASFMLGYREAILWNLGLGVATLYFIFTEDLFARNTLQGYATDFIAAYVFAVLASLGYERMRALTEASAREEHQRLQQVINHKNLIAQRNEKLFEDLNFALREVRELTGLIPICATCKKIRSDDDFWEHVEAYLHKRTQLTFSHSLCPGCSEEAMGQLDRESETSWRQETQNE